MCNSKGNGFEGRREAGWTAGLGVDGCMHLLVVRGAGQICKEAIRPLYTACVCVTAASQQDEDSCYKDISPHGQKLARKQVWRRHW